MEQAVQRDLDQINKLIFVKKYEEAWNMFNRVINKTAAKDSLLFHLRRIELASKLHKLPNLYEEYEKLANKPTATPAQRICLLLVELHSDLLTPDEAIARFQNLIKEKYENAAVYYGIAFSLELQGNIDRAISNYQKSVEFDQDWYPSYFGLSQLFYQKGDHKSGDQYFLLFEKAAVFNVYGNFETHRALSQEFSEREMFAEAETAMTTLSEWWNENKGYCPDEIQIYEHLSVARINTLKGDNNKAISRREAAFNLCEMLLANPSPDEGVVYFVAKTLEDFAETELAIRFYKKALRIAGNNPTLVRKIGGQFLALGEYQLAIDLFNEGYEVYPDNPEIRFCILVSKLKHQGVNVEEYLIGKERLKQLLESETDRVEVLALLHSLLAKFQDDPDIHMHIADLYLRLGNIEKAGKHFKRMFELDSRSRQSALRYVSYLMHYGDSDDAIRILDKTAAYEGLSRQEQTEIDWLRANYYARLQQYAKSQEHLAKAIHSDPWNVSYVVQQVVNLTALSDMEPSLKRSEEIVEKLARMDETNLEWTQFEAVTAKLEQESVPELIYARRKLRFLYADGNEHFIRQLVLAACQHNPQQGTYDFLRLINTNFDSASVYWALGVLYKELWQLEVASMWFEQTLLYPGLTEDLKANCLLDMADCNVWLGRNMSKAIEYAKLAGELGVNDKVRARNILSHAYIKAGQVKLAETQLSEAVDHNDFDAMYLKGLIEYRNGARKKANEIWKPLLSKTSSNIRAHTIKQEILKYYFDGAPYLKVN